MSRSDSPSAQDPNPNPSPGRSPPSSPQSLLPPPSSTTESASAAAVTTASTAVKNPRRLPPPCWSHEETIALIDAYGDKWHALHRGSLKANHWQEVAETVAARCPGAMPQKTAVQCRHKMEKLRKRYRTEIQRARSVPVSRFASSWVHYKRMETMEKGPETKPDNGADSGDDDRDDGEDDYPPRYPFSGDGYKNGGSAAKTTPGFFNRNGIAGSRGSGAGSSSVGSGGIRIRIPTGVSIAQPGPRFPGKIDQKYTTNTNSGATANVSANPKPGIGAGFNYGARMARASEGGRAGAAMARRERETGDDPMGEIASAIKLLGDTLMRTEQSKMEMTREIEAMKMEMEMKRTEMILESQQRIVESFAKALAEGKKTKKPRRIESDDS
ncbi:PREDICTED: trihelix transcription factor ASIL2 [Tarenaya hassleriana]|uniref:trihelix transcription factor ASIL2 n=1 Tax=Tarenaya hassleriana TaxID=28532 RepID=UPI00053C75A4|nr:PREDICTED: trihelix transcription factor ASIL2 [Tarenaya hassleriana]